MRIAAIFALSLACFGVSYASAQNGAPGRPDRIDGAVAAIEAADWARLEPGLAVKRVVVRDGPSLTAFRIDQRRFRFEIAVQSGPDGERVDSFGPRTGGVLAVNGGFFGERDHGKGLYPVGLLRTEAGDRSPNWPSAGGYLLLGAEGASIAQSSANPPDAPKLLQSKPLLIEPGGRWAMNTNQQLGRPRTALCILPGGEAILMLVSGPGLSLYETGWLFREREIGGHFGCDSALALDGGGSTQLWVDGRDDLEIVGETAVHNSLVLLRR